MATQELQADWVGIAETHLDTAKAHVLDSSESALRATQAYTFSNCTFSTSDLDYKTEYKHGVVLQFAVNNLATRTVNSFADRYGRYTSQTFIGRIMQRLLLLLCIEYAKEIRAQLPCTPNKEPCY